MTTDNKFTGTMHTHHPVVLAVHNRKQALRLSAMLDELENHTDGSVHAGLIMMAVLPSGGCRVILCRGCLAAARQQMLDAAGVMEDLIAYPAEGDSDG